MRRESYACGKENALNGSEREERKTKKKMTGLQ